MRRSDLAALTAGAALLLSSAAAGAYCRTSSCDPDAPDAHTGAVCNPPQPDDCGIPIAWPSASPCVEYSVQENASKKVTFAQTETVMKAAFATWMSAPCPGGGSPHILVSEGAPAVCNEHEYNQDAGNANIIMYHDDFWPYEGSSNTLALTTVTYNLDTGDIYDADMEINTHDIDFTVGDTNIEYDLQSVVTHESGHFLGMAHSHDMSAVMYPVYNQGTTSLRHLTADDIVGCDPTPRHGFSPLCAADQPAPSKGCGTCAAGARPDQVPGTGLLAAFAMLVLGLRRSRWGTR